MTDEAPSQFLPGTKLQYAWDSVSLGALKDCPRRYQYSIIKGWRSKVTGIDLSFGLAYHHGLELYDRKMAEGLSHDDALLFIVRDALISTIDWPKEEDSNKNRSTLLRSLIWYLEEFKDDNAKTVTLANGKPAVELSFTLPLDFGPRANVPYLDELGPVADFVSSQLQPQNYILCGHIDRLVSFTGEVFVMDRKTTKTTISPSYFSNYDPDNQMTLYSLAGQIIWNAPVKGVIIDAAQIAVGFTKFERGITWRTSGQLDEWLKDLKYWLGQAEQYAADDYYPMNDRSCRMCQFKKICSKDPAVRETFLASDFDNSRPWNPLSRR